MADEQRKRLSFANSFLQSQAAWKLYDGILGKMVPGSVLNEKSVEIPELKVLWEMIEDSSESAARLCSQCLVQLVFDGHADLDYILKGLLNAVPSVRNLSGIIKALSSLLAFQIYQCVKNGIEYKCPFSLR
ncbi:focadhesin-like [Orbicella faveolata]|uniref:focadhesin-like n=1 Tax=Orbicella faveolata TaxID=48498 RepID=UPI0009E56DEF|nr:focadhesin-like [Orbicella faveolata]